MPLDTLENALAHELSDLHSAENQFAKALQQVVKNADSTVVKQLAQEHHQETLGQIENLKQAFSVLGKKPERITCKGAQGIVEENNSTIKEEKPKGAIKDTALVGGSLRVEHYEIAGYTSAIALAKSLGKREVVQLLQTNLKQEQAAAKKLEAAGAQLLKDSAASTSVVAAPQPATAKTQPAKTPAAKAQVAKAQVAKAQVAKAPAKASALKVAPAKVADSAKSNGAKSNGAKSAASATPTVAESKAVASKTAAGKEKKSSAKKGRK